MHPRTPIGGIGVLNWNWYQHKYPKPACIPTKYPQHTSSPVQKLLPSTTALWIFCSDAAIITNQCLSSTTNSRTPKYPLRLSRNLSTDAKASPNFPTDSTPTQIIYNWRRGSMEYCQPTPGQKTDNPSLPLYLIGASSARTHYPTNTCMYTPSMTFVSWNCRYLLGVWSEIGRALSR